MLKSENNETLSLLSSAANSINKAKLFALWASLAAKKSPLFHFMVVKALCVTVLLVGVCFEPCICAYRRRGGIVYYSTDQFHWLPKGYHLLPNECHQHYSIANCKGCFFWKSGGAAWQCNFSWDWWRRTCVFENRHEFRLGRIILVFYIPCHHNVNEFQFVPNMWKWHFKLQKPQILKKWKTFWIDRNCRAFW